MVFYYRLVTMVHWTFESQKSMYLLRLTCFSLLVKLLFC